LKDYIPDEMIPPEVSRVQFILAMKKAKSGQKKMSMREKRRLYDAEIERRAIELFQAEKARETENKEKQ
jgi:hypothetical protein